MDKKCIFNLQQSYIIHNNTLRKGRRGKRGRREREREGEKEGEKEGGSKGSFFFSLRIPHFDVGEQLVARLAARLAAASVLSQGLIS